MREKNMDKNAGSIGVAETALHPLWQGIWIVVLTLLSALFLFPIIVVLYNSFKGRLYISDAPFRLPDAATFAGLENYLSGIEKTGIISAFGWSLFITVCSVALIIFGTSMTAWYLVRVKNLLTELLYYLFVFSMIVPFQMVMFTMSKVANILYLDNPLAMEEAAMIDGAGPIQTFFRVIFPILKPTAVTVAILNAMWIWNDYLLPYLVIGSDYKTLPIAIQYLKGGYGSIDMGAMMAMLVLAIIPIVIFYLSCQKYIVRGVAAGAVKG